MDTRRKIISLDTLKRALHRHKRLGQKIAFTNGCFDILHFGHVRYLEKAKQKGRILIIGLNSDRSVRKIKGAGRPVQHERARAGVLAALECVDYVTLFEETTPHKLISEIKPDVLIKGADWKGKRIVGSEVVLRNKGRVELIAFEPGFSTTQIITRIKKSA